MPKRVEKSSLPSKVCPVCSRPFSWRKKWAKNWDGVKFCSRRCRETRGPEPRLPASDEPTNASIR
ncbi:DUF2256 domain-containing protein [Agrobacterium sp. CNPSo 3708]|uniref:DUF2256 domain-containing protein n=1 Tax=Agrobacterium sp. CNPSo 3708 TaxID=3028150 RepID=UPI00236484E9|nr:DUF2256 domain-containing protein [Agrobacterium sp. CNPSo 3708]MDD1498830.1 DUF2256 domain-containing protein [Agrobacterium sp. CNPSo 3708]